MKKIINLYKKYEEIINYIIAGGLTTFVSLFTYYLCVFTFLDPNKPLKLQIANIISWICCVTFAYFINRSFVFKSKSKNKLNEAIKFYLSRLSTLFIDMLSMFLLVTVFSINDKISKILVQFIILVLNYIFSKFIVFSQIENKKTKIIFTAYDLNIGGIETALINMLKNFDYKKYDVTLFLEKKEGIFLNEIPENVKIINYNICDSKNVIYRKIRNRLKLIYHTITKFKKYDRGVCYASHRMVGNRLIPHISKKNIIWIHGNYFHDLESFNVFLKDFNIIKYKDIVFVSNTLKDKFLKYYNLKDKKLHVLNNIIDYKRMIELSKEEKINKNKLTLINVGRHTEEEKNLSMLFNVIKKLLDESYDFELLLIGDGKDHEYYKELCKSLKIDNAVKFLGKKKNPFIYYKIADAVLLTSKYEGNPVVFLESKIFNVPIITTDVSDAKIDIDNKYGLVSKNNLKSYYDTLKSFLDDGFKVEEKFDAKKYNLEIMNKIYELLDKR